MTTLSVALTAPAATKAREVVYLDFAKKALDPVLGLNAHLLTSYMKAYMLVDDLEMQKAVGLHVDQSRYDFAMRELSNTRQIWESVIQSKP